MIVYEREHDFVMIRQYDHSNLSADICSRWEKTHFPGMNHWEDIIFGIHEHDRSWIDLDDTPLLNDAKQSPYSFIDMPLKLKIPFYKKGVDEIEVENANAALLCSLHFASFFDGSAEPSAKLFFEEEKERQEKLKQLLQIESVDQLAELMFHLHLLQFGDDISLYICLQEPGVSKEDEISWFREGFPQDLTLSGEKIVAHWLDREHISLEPFPLESETKVSIKIKEVKKYDIREKGLSTAYHEAGWSERHVTLVKKQAK